MKSNEFNSPKIDNVNKNIDAEFTKAQSSEYSSFGDSNPTTQGSKDELNDTSTVNDSVEANTLKSTKEKEQKRKESENTSEGVKSISSSANTIASGISTAAVTAATAGIVAIGAVVGIDVFHTGNQNKELVTFLSSEIGATDINFSFALSSELLTYYGTPETEPSEGDVMVLIRDGRQFEEIYYIAEYEHIDEINRQYFASISGLSADTDYGMLLYVEKAIPSDTQDKVTYERTSLASRSFRTQAMPAVLTFNNFEVTHNSVNFTVLVAKSAIDYDPTGAQSSNIVAMLVKDDVVEDTYSINDLSEVNENYVEGQASFTGLDSSSNYRIDIYYQRETLLGSKSFKTTELASGFIWQLFVAEYNELRFTFSMNASYIGYVEGETSPTINGELTSNGTVINTIQVSLSRYTDTICLGSSIFENLTPQTEYNIQIQWDKGNDTEILAERSFVTPIHTYFNAPTFVTACDFSRHQIKLTLDFVDDPDQPKYNGLSIQFYDKSGATLGSAFALEKTTEQQILGIPATLGETTTYAFELGDIGSYQVLNDGVEIVSNPIEFIDSVPTISAVNTDYFVVQDAASGKYYLPIQIEYYDPYDQVGESFVVSFYSMDSSDYIASALALKSSGYVYAEFDDAEAVTDYLATPSDLEVHIYPIDDPTMPLYGAQSIRLSTPTKNVIYSLEFTDIGIEYSSFDSTWSDYNIGYKMVCALVDTSLTAKLEFRNETDASAVLTYQYDLNLANYSYLNANTIDIRYDYGDASEQTFATIKSRFKDVPMIVNVLFQENSGATEQSVRVMTDFYLNITEVK